MAYANDPEQAGDPGPDPHEPYGKMERQLIFKLLAAHALCDAEFYDQLREHPQAAAESIHITLTESEVHYIRHTVEWDTISTQAEGIREALHLERVTNSW